MRPLHLTLLLSSCTWLLGAGGPPVGETLPLKLGEVQVGLRAVATDLDRPLHVTGAGDGSGRLFIVEQGGKIWQLKGQDKTLWHDHGDRVVRQHNEQGLLGLAFAPDFSESGTFYLSYTTQGEPAGESVISRMRLDPQTGRPAPSTEQVILTAPQPAGNHNGGTIVFGPDGMLYIGWGDGGAAGDRFKNSRTNDTLLAKLLRIDVSKPGPDGQPYAIPAGNPLIGKEGRDEIWAMGLRNPWKFSFDSETGDLWIADVGQNKYEEVHVAPGSLGGVDYGWNVLEGSHCYEPSEGCDRAGLALPVLEYDHSRGCSITGGHVYRGRQVPALQGIYLASDYCTGNLWTVRFRGWPEAETLSPTSAVVLDPRDRAITDEVGQVRGNISSFGTDDEGEIYLVDHKGTVYRVVPG
ncbi:MAG: glucose dehydrogenase [Deltaproteobacteria bacterium]|nr:MAG: glucose dehydrogenase [Deltaproteobacteria bacterium]